MPGRKVSNNLTAELPQSLVRNQPAPAGTRNDEYRGMGGSYVLDPETGKRVRIEGPALEQGPTEQELEKMEAIDDESE